MTERWEPCESCDGDGCDHCADMGDVCGVCLLPPDDCQCEPEETSP